MIVHERFGNEQIALFNWGLLPFIIEVKKIKCSQCSADLMGKFYNNIKEGTSKDESLRIAKLQYIENECDHPLSLQNRLVLINMKICTVSSRKCSTKNNFVRLFMYVL